MAWTFMPLSGKQFALLDRADYERFGNRVWYLASTGYARRKGPRNGGSQATVFLHREILGLAHGDSEVDHINRDRLDNRRVNLRLATRAEQCQNIPAKGRSRFRGVSFDSRSMKKQWRAGAKLNGRAHYLGHFETEEEAAEAASVFRREHMPYSQEANSEEG
jgi:hypothetical protein